MCEVVVDNRILQVLEDYWVLSQGRGGVAARSTEANFMFEVLGLVEVFSRSQG